MKKNSWLGVLENLSLLGSGVGAIASVLSSQASYAIAPLSLALVLGALNRNRYEEMSEEERKATLAEFDQRVTQKIDLLNQQVAQLPKPELIDRLRKGVILKNRELAEHLHTEISALQQEMHQRFESIEQQGLKEFRQDLALLSEKYFHLSEGVGQLHAGLAQLANSRRVDTLEEQLSRIKAEMAEIQGNLDSFANQTRPNLTALQEQITRLNRQLGKLHPPVDVTSLKQEVGEIIRIIADLVPKRDMVALVNEVKELRHQQDTLKQALEAIETAAVNFKRNLNQLSQAAQHPSDLTSANALSAFLSITAAQSGAEAEFRSALYPELQELASNYITHVRSQLEAVQEFTENLAQQQRQLREQMNQLPKSLDMIAMQRQLNDLAKWLPSTETALKIFKVRIQELIQQEVQYINNQLQSFAVSNAELIFDLNPTQPTADGEREPTGNTTILTEALEGTRNRLILIWPWSSQYRLNDALLQKFEAFLRQNRQLDLGWCHIAERDDNRFLGKMQRGWMAHMGQHNEWQETLRRLLHLKRMYPDQFQFKILGTRENFLVSDESFAVLGVHDALKTSTAFSELQLKLRTRDPEVIQRLIQRYDSSILAHDDVTAYWNRAVTRHDLGDRSGAIDDYSHLLSLNPRDAIAYNYRGLVYYDAGDIEAAIEDFTESIHYNPHQAAAFCNRGFIRSEQDDISGAISDYSLAIQAQPTCAIAFFYRALAWQKVENHQEAIHDYTEAIYLVPDAAAARYYRGLAWQKLGNYPGAIGDLEVAANLFKARGNLANAEKALKQLTKLKQITPARSSAFASNANSHAAHSLPPAQANGASAIDPANIDPANMIGFFQHLSDEMAATERASNTATPSGHKADLDSRSFHTPTPNGSASGRSNAELASLHSESLSELDLGE